jgi:hypothetical protein
MELFFQLSARFFRLSESMELFLQLSDLFLETEYQGAGTE